MKETVTVRIAIDGDFKHLRLLNLQVHEDHVRMVPSLFKIASPETLEVFLRSFASEAFHYIYVIEVDNEIIGYTAFFLKERTDNAMVRGAKILHIEQMAIDQKQQRKGFGKMLMDEIKEVALRKGCDSISLDVAVANTQAIDFYLAMDFQESFIRMFHSLG